MKDIRKKMGVLGEAIAASYLQEQGVRILQKNYRCRYGEIDLIGWDGSYYLVIEVKYRNTLHQGMPAEAVNYRKQRKICMTFNHYRMINQLDDYTPVRFDIIEMYRDGQCHWLKNAYDFME